MRRVLGALLAVGLLACGGAPTEMPTGMTVGDGGADAVVDVGRDVPFESAPATGDSGDSGEAGTITPSCVSGLPARSYDLSRDCYATGPCTRCNVTQPGTRYVCSGCTSEPFNDGGCDVPGAGYPIVFQPGQCTQDTDGSWCCLDLIPDGGAPATCVETDSVSAACATATDYSGSPTPVAYSCPVNAITGFADTSSVPGLTCAPTRNNYGSVTAAGASANEIACCAN